MPRRELGAKPRVEAELLALAAERDIVRQPERRFVTEVLMLLSVLVATALSASPIPTATPTPLPSVALPPELARVLTDYEQAWQARDAAALASLFTEDGFVLSGGHAPVRGRLAIQRFYSGHGGPLSLRALHYAAEGAVGFIIGAYAGKVGDPDDGKFTLTLRREASGRWRIVSDMDNGNRAPRPTAQ